MDFQLRKSIDHIVNFQESLTIVLYCFFNLFFLTKRAILSWHDAFSDLFLYVYFWMIWKKKKSSSIEN